MLRTIKIMILAVVVVVGAVLVYATTMPDTFRVQRAASIDAPPEAIFPLVNDLRRWDAWSPWEKKDPAMKRAYLGAESGKGAIYAWDGDRNVGRGQIEIVEAVPPSKITMRLDFERPFETHNVVEFAFAERGGKTDVTWVMHGPVPYFAKIMHLFFDMDRMVGGDFEAGLSDLKAIAERRP